MPMIMTALRALRRVATGHRKFRWKWRRLHFVPLDPLIVSRAPDVQLAAREGEPLCGRRLAHRERDVTSQPGSVTCFACALAIESDRDRWVPRVWPDWNRDGAFAYCRNCGGTDLGPPGCRCTGARA